MKRTGDYSSGVGGDGPLLTRDATSRGILGPDHPVVARKGDVSYLPLRLRFDTRIIRSATGKAVIYKT